MGAILCFHSLTTPELPAEGDAHVPWAFFQRTVRLARRLGEVVPLSTLVARHRAGRSTAGLTALTFDDAYAALFGHLAALVRAAEQHGNQAALHRRVGDRWTATTWAEYRTQVEEAARGLIALGLPAGAGVVILGSNRPEWFVADLAAIAASALPAGIYTTSTPDQVRYIAERILRSAGFRILTASNGAEALQLLDQGRQVRLILTDLQMPVMGGRELSEHVSRRADAPPVIFMTGYSEDTHGEGADPHLTLLAKPFTPERLIEFVKSVLG